MESSMERRRKRVFDTIQIGHRTDWVTLKVIAKTEDGEVMAVAHKEYPR